MNILIQTAEALDAHERVHGLFVRHEARERGIIHVHQQSTLPAAGQQCCRCAGHGIVQNLGGVYLTHSTAVIGNDRQEVDKLLHLLFGACAGVGVKAATIIGDLLQSAIQRKVKNIALLLHDLPVHFPRTLHTESSLEIGLRALQVAQHEDAGPGLHSDAGGQFAAGESDGLAAERVFHGFLHGGKGGKADARAGARAHVHGVIVIKHVLSLGQKILHGLAGGNAGKEPNSVGQDAQEPPVGEGHGGPLCAQLQLVHGGFQIGAANQIQPLLDVIFIEEFGVFAVPLRLEEHIQIELVELALFRNLADAVGDLVGHHDHTGQRGIGVVLANPVVLGTLLVGIGPVVNLLFDKLAGVEGPERRAGEIEIIAGRDGQPCFVAGIAGMYCIEVDVHVVFVRIHKELLCVICPGTKVVFVENDKIPVHGMNPFVMGLDAAGFAQAEEILEGTEANDGTVFIRLGILLVGAGFAGVLRPGDELPALKIHMGHQVFPPRTLDGGLEGENQNPLKAHALC